jgi:hypothetical protein
MSYGGWGGGVAPFKLGQELDMLTHPPTIEGRGCRCISGEEIEGTLYVIKIVFVRNDLGVSGKVFRTPVTRG